SSAENGLPDRAEPSNVRQDVVAYQRSKSHDSGAWTRQPHKSKGQPVYRTARSRAKPRSSSHNAQQCWVANQRCGQFCEELRALIFPRNLELGRYSVSTNSD